MGNSERNLIAIILAAGKGTRIRAKKTNKVMFSLGGKPMIRYTVDLLKKSGIKKIIIVVGFGKQSIINYFGKNFTYVCQKKRLGTGHAVQTAFLAVPKKFENILVINADDSAFYPTQVIKNLIKKHLKEKADLTFLTVEMRNPNIARVIRDSQGRILGVIEQQNLKSGQKKIKEVNCGCYCFSFGFLSHFLNKLKKNKVSHEYYITELIEIAIKNNRTVKAFKMNREEYFQSINTREQFLQAKNKMRKKQKNEKKQIF